MMSFLHRQDTHVGQVAVMSDQRGTFGLHQVAPHSSEFRLRILLSEFCHEVACVQVSAGLSCYQIVFHSSMLRD